MSFNKIKRLVKLKYKRHIFALQSLLIIAVRR